MARLLTFASAELPADLRCQILSFMRVAWWEGFTGALRRRDWIITEEDHPVHLVLVEGTILVAHLGVVWKNLDHAGTTYRTYGLTGVFTYPTFRREGHGARLVAAGTDYIRRSDADVGMFHCAPALRDFYARAGWIPIDGATTLIGRRDAPDVVDEVMMMQFLSERGRAGRADFARVPVFFGGDCTW